MNKLPELELGTVECPADYTYVFIDGDTKEQVPIGDVLFMYNTLARMFNGAIEEFNKNV